MSDADLTDSNPGAQSGLGLDSDASDHNPDTLDEMLNEIKRTLDTSLQGFLDGAVDDTTGHDSDVIDIVAEIDSQGIPKPMKLLSTSSETIESLDKCISNHLIVLHPDLLDCGLVGVLSDLLPLCLSRYRISGHLSDLEDGIGFGRRAERCGTADDPPCASLLANLSTALNLRYLCSDSPEDLEESISLIQRAIEITPSDSNEFSFYSFLHAAVLRVRYQHTSSLEDLRAAISKTRDVLDRFPRNMPTVCRKLSASLFSMLRILSRSGEHSAEVFDTLQHFKHSDPTIEAFLDHVERETPINDLDLLLKGSTSEAGPLPNSAPADDDAFSTELLGEEVGPNNPIEIKKLPLVLVYHRGGDQPDSTEVIPVRDPKNVQGICALLVKGGVIEEAQLKDDWAYTVDNGQASAFFAREPGELPQLPCSILLCQRCKRFKTISPGSQLSFSCSDFDSSGLDCGLCKLLYPFRNDSGTITISRAGVSLKTNTSDRWILRICADPESRNPPEGVQIGFPILPQRDTQVHFELLRHWLRICNEEHECFEENESLQSLLPTRVIDVNSETLYISEHMERGRYVTLSHCWGEMSNIEKESYCTYRCNFNQKRTKLDLPKTFRDAIAVTRNMGVRFLWIDSICIIQPHKDCSSKACDSLDDWNNEAYKMGGYYGKSYVTIAATSAQNSKAGFLQRPAGRPDDCVPIFETSDYRLFASTAVDNFQKDVEAAILNKRGWVLQERALSRRTIHFSSIQTFWECKKGIRCETMTNMSNPRSGVLGDPRFPESIMEYSKVNRSRLIGFLFENYSTRGLTHKTDLPLAINALLRCLSKELNTKTEYGIIVRYLHRSLLWKRAGDAPLARISYPEGRKVPSWSWMAFDGHIRYLNPPSYDNIEWNDSVQYVAVEDSPEGTGGPQRPSHGLKAHLRAPARSFPSGFHDTSQVVFDELPRTDLHRLKYVIVGRTVSNESSHEQEYFVLAVKLVKEVGHVYERVGVGCIGAKEISLKVSPEVVWII